MPITPSVSTSADRQSVSIGEVKAKSGVMDGVKIGFGMFILLPILIIVGLIIFGQCSSTLINKRIQETGRETKTAAAQNRIAMLGCALAVYHMDNNRYPTTQQGLMALYNMPTSPPVPTGWSGNYLKRLPPDDPWGHRYKYLCPGRVNSEGYDLYSLGRDGKDGGDGEDADIREAQ